MAEVVRVEGREGNEMMMILGRTKVEGLSSFLAREKGGRSSETGDVANYDLGLCPLKNGVKSLK